MYLYIQLMKFWEVEILGVEILRLTWYHVLKAESANEIGVLFQVLKGELRTSTSGNEIPSQIQGYSPPHNPQSCGKWSE